MHSSPGYPDDQSASLEEGRSSTTNCFNRWSYQCTLSWHGTSSLCLLATLRLEYSGGQDYTTGYMHMKTCVGIRNMHLISAWRWKGMTGIEVFSYFVVFATMNGWIAVARYMRSKIPLADHNTRAFKSNDTSNLLCGSFLFLSSF